MPDLSIGQIMESPARLRFNEIGELSVQGMSPDRLLG